MLDRVIHLGVKIHRYRAQKATFFGEKRAQTLSLSQSDIKLDQDGPNFSYVYLQKHIRNMPLAGWGNTSYENSDAQRGTKYCTVGKLRHILGKAVKECATVTKEGWRGAQSGHKKTHSLARTHVLDSKVTLTHRERNDGGRERREEGRNGRKKKTVTIKRHFKPLFNGCSAVALSSCL